MIFSLKNIFFIALFLVFNFKIYGQNTENIGKTLVIEGFRGNIRIEGQAIDSITINVNPETPYSLDKQDNVTYIRTASTQMSQYEIKVPYNTYIKILWSDEGLIEVKRIKSGIEVQARNSTIKLSEIKGWAFLQNEDGNIEADFAEVTSQKPIALTSLTGNLILNIPENTQAEIETKTTQQVESDFNMNVSSPQTANAGNHIQNFDKKEKSKKDVHKKLKREYNTPHVIRKKINNGQTLFKLSTRNGKISIKKRF